MLTAGCTSRWNTTATLLLLQVGIHSDRLRGHPYNKAMFSEDTTYVITCISNVSSREATPLIRPEFPNPKGNFTRRDRSIAVW